MENQEKFGNLHLQLSLMKIPMQMWIFFFLPSFSKSGKAEINMNLWKIKDFTNKTQTLWSRSRDWKQGDPEELPKFWLMQKKNQPKIWDGHPQGLIPTYPNPWGGNSTPKLRNPPGKGLG